MAAPRLAYGVAAVGQGLGTLGSLLGLDDRGLGGGDTVALALWCGLLPTDDAA